MRRMSRLRVHARYLIDAISAQYIKPSQRHRIFRIHQNDGSSLYHLYTIASMSFSEFRIDDISHRTPRALDSETYSTRPSGNQPGLRSIPDPGRISGHDTMLVRAQSSAYSPCCCQHMVERMVVDRVAERIAERIAERMPECMTELSNTPRGNFNNRQPTQAGSQCKAKEIYCTITLRD